MELTWNSKALVITLLFRLLFGGYIIGLDQYHFNDFESVLIVLLIYGLIAIFTALFLLGISLGLMGIIGLDVILIILQSLFIIVTLGQIAEPGLHDPLSNWWATLLMYSFSLLTLIFSIRTYRESRG